MKETFVEIGPEKKSDERGSGEKSILLNAEVLLFSTGIKARDEHLISEYGQNREVVWVAYLKCVSKGEKEAAEEIRRRFADIVDGANAKR